LTGPDRAGSNLTVRRNRAGLLRKSLLVSLALSAALWSPGARAGDNDVVLWKLGNPDPITICTLCDGTDNSTKAADPKAQGRFARMSSSLGLAFVPAFSETGASLGQAGFELGFSQSFQFLSLDNEDWATDGSQGVARPPLLALSTATVRKGLGGSFDLGVFATYMAQSSMLSVGAELRAAIIDGLDYAPDVAIRAYGARVTGTRELDLTIAGADLMISKSFGVAGMIKLQPYGQYGMAFVNANTGVINFHPTSQDPTNPTAEDGVFREIHMLDNRYTRVALGLRLVAGAAVIGLEGNYAFGTNPVASDTGGTDAPTPNTQTTHEFGVNAHLGVQF
jgi:hypothetical protein